MLVGLESAGTSCWRIREMAVSKVQGFLCWVAVSVAVVFLCSSVSGEIFFSETFEDTAVGAAPDVATWQDQGGLIIAEGGVSGQYATNAAAGGDRWATHWKDDPLGGGTNYADPNNPGSGILYGYGLMKFGGGGNDRSQLLFARNDMTPWGYAYAKFYPYYNKFQFQEGSGASYAMNVASTPSSDPNILAYDEWFAVKTVMDFAANHQKAYYSKGGETQDDWREGWDYPFENPLPFGQANGLGVIQLYVFTATAAGSTCWDNLIFADEDLTPDQILNFAECGDWGYAEGDLDEDCRVNVTDLAIAAAGWLECTDPTNPTECPAPAGGPPVTIYFEETFEDYAYDEPIGPGDTWTHGDPCEPNALALVARDDYAITGMYATNVDNSSCAATHRNPAGENYSDSGVLYCHAAMRWSGVGERDGWLQHFSWVTSDFQPYAEDGSDGWIYSRFRMRGDGTEWINLRPYLGAYNGADGPLQSMVITDPDDPNASLVWSDAPEDINANEWFAVQAIMDIDGGVHKVYYSKGGGNQADWQKKWVRSYTIPTGELLSGGTNGLGRVAISTDFTTPYQNAIDNILITDQRLVPDQVLHYGSCGEWGYPPGDLDENCYSNIADFGRFAGSWLDCTDPLGLGCAPAAP